MGKPTKYAEVPGALGVLNHGSSRKQGGAVPGTRRKRCGYSSRFPSRSCRLQWRNTALPTLGPPSHLLDPPTDQTQPRARGQEGLRDAVLEVSLSRAQQGRDKNRGNKKAKVRMPVIYF